MPLGVTLLELRRALRAETGTSLNPAQGVQAQQSLDIILARQQRELWDAYNWQHLRNWVDLPVNEGQSRYDYPKEMSFDQITNISIATALRGNSSDPDEITSSSSWQPLAYGIKSWMAKLGPVERGMPKRWRNVATVDTSGAVPITNPVGQLEILPAPMNDDMMLRFDGMMPLSPLVADTDSCVIDSEAIVLFAAAEVMAMQKNEAAPMKLTKAQNYLRRLLADQGADKRANYNMGGNHRGGIDPDRSRRLTPYIDYIPG
jgi:hypothetical protein